MLGQQCKRRRAVIAWCAVDALSKPYRVRWHNDCYRCAVSSVGHESIVWHRAQIHGGCKNRRAAIRWAPLKAGMYVYWLLDPILLLHIENILQLIQKVPGSTSAYSVGSVRVAQSSSLYSMSSGSSCVSGEFIQSNTVTNRPDWRFPNLMQVCQIYQMVRQIPKYQVRLPHHR